MTWKPWFALRPGRGTTKFVAASDAAPLSKLLADYVCDGTADEVEIAAAFAALPSVKGTVRLSEGTFNISTTLTLSIANSSLTGSGFSTILKAITDMAVVQTSIMNVTADFIQISELSVDGNKSNQASGDCPGIRVSGSGVIVRNCYIHDTKTTSATGNIFVSGNNVLIQGCLSNDASAGSGIFGSTGTALRVIGCSCTGNGAHGIQITGSSSVAQGNYCASNTFDGVNIGGTASGSTLVGNFATLNGRFGVQVAIGVTDSLIMGNLSVGNSQTTTLASPNISLTGTRCVAIGNVARQGSQTNKPSYGLLNTGTNNLYRTNDLFDGGNTGEISESGTHTRKQARSQVAVAGGDVINTTAAETNFATGHAVAADALKHIGRVIRIYAAGTYGTLGSGTVTLQLKLKVGTTTILDFGTITTAISITARRWRMEAVCTVVAVGASGSLECAGAARIPTANDDVTASRPDVGSTTTIDTTAAQTVQISAQHGASSASNTVVLREFVMELLN